MCCIYICSIYLLVFGVDDESFKIFVTAIYDLIKLFEVVGWKMFVWRSQSLDSLGHFHFPFVRELRTWILSETWSFKIIERLNGRNAEFFVTIFFRLHRFALRFFFSVSRFVCPITSPRRLLVFGWLWLKNNSLINFRLNDRQLVIHILKHRFHVWLHLWVVQSLILYLQVIKLGSVLKVQLGSSTFTPRNVVAWMEVLSQHPHLIQVFHLLQSIHL